MFTTARIRPFKVRFKIAQSTFSDYESFIRSFSRSAQLQISEFHEAGYCYVFDNELRATLNRDSQIEVFSPVLDGRNAGEVNRIVDALQIMNVRVGENCHADLRYERILDTLGMSKPFEKVLPEFWCGLSLVVFLVLKTVEFQTQEVSSLEIGILFQILGYLVVACFSICFYKAVFSNRTIPTHLLPAKGEPEAQSIEPSLQKDIQNPSDNTEPAETPPWQELASRIRAPLDNVMAYTRFYQTTLEPDSQHSRDLSELMEQAIHIQEILNRLESVPEEARPNAENKGHLLDNRNLSRRMPRVLELNPMVVQGQDPLGQEFETPSYTLNTSSWGACLLLPDRVIKPGQRVVLKKKSYTTEAEVRWVIQGRGGRMAFAGVQFAAPSPFQEK